MNCCKENNSNQGEGAGRGQHQGCGSGVKHMLMMLVCCLAPLGGILLLNQFGYNGTASYLMLLVCPLMHLFMMRGMGKKENETTVEKQHG